MTRIHPCIALTMCLFTLIGESFAQASSVKFTDSGILMAGSSPEADFANCQPLRGDFAEITGMSQKIFGTEVLPVRVTSGHCAGVKGWVANSRIETAAGLAPSEAIIFSESDRLFNILGKTNIVKAACQPLRGDTAQILETARFVVTDVYRVKVLIGRCQGTIGWVDASGLERIATVR